MALAPLTEKQKSLIVSNVLKAVNDIEKLSNTGYKFLYLCSGFIAHYNRFGFINAFSQRSLKQAIIQNANANMWKNFTPNDADYAYYMSKADVYKRILAKI